MDFKKQKPIYQQIAEMLCERIVQGEWAAEERIPSVRDVAVQLGVNPNTILRTFDYLQSSGIIYNKRGVGYFVAADGAKCVQTLQRQAFLEEELPDFFQRLRLLGLTLDDLRQYEPKVVGV
ncbi:MAG: GntR family transcriptional regulator [Bacteroidales bacterium]|nr:GntR family transcriptional regulator [Bacteroidales bacterium]